MNNFDNMPLSADQAEKIRKQLRPLDGLARDAQAQIDSHMADIHPGWLNMAWSDKKDRIVQGGFWHAYDAADQLTSLYDTFRFAARSVDVTEDHPISVGDLKRVLHNFQAQLGNRTFTQNFGDRFQLSPAHIASILRVAELQFMPAGAAQLPMLNRPN